MTVRDHLSDRRAWTRLLFMLLFILLYGVAELVITVVVLVQAGSSLLAGRANSRLCHLGGQLADYVAGVVRFLTYRSDMKPYPFSSWPVGEEVEAPEEETGEPDQDGG